MVTAIASAIAAGPVGRSYGKLRKSRVITAPIWDWVIPSTLVALIVAAMGWVILVAQ
jgi:hypothetical protein